MSDRSILDHIKTLVSEEQRLRSDAREVGANAAQLRQTQEQLDRCWGVLRQRRAEGESGGDPGTAERRDAHPVGHDAG